MLMFSYAAAGLACSRDSVSSAFVALVVSPSSLEFAATYVGFPKEASLTVSNPGAMTQTVAFAAGAPFRVQPSIAAVPGGDHLIVQVWFEPAAAGAVRGELEISGALVAQVPLLGIGVLPPACSPSAACHADAFDPDAGICLDSPLPDETTCESGAACLENARCYQGACLGTARACDDGNACTLDVCDADAGCVHIDVSGNCPAGSDPCQLPACEPASGCGFTPARDGTTCGPSRCGTAWVCVNGTCQTRSTPSFEVCCVGAAGGREPIVLVDAGIFHVWAIAADDAGVYWFNGRDPRVDAGLPPWGGPSLMGVGPSGGPPTTLVLGDPFHEPAYVLGLDGTDVY
jgi:hypothetical protein